MPQRAKLSSQASVNAPDFGSFEEKKRRNMNLQEFLNHMNAGKRVIAGSEVHQFMSAASFEVIELAYKLSASHDLGEIQELSAQITSKPVNRTFALFPPFYTDFGKNITVEDGVFINSGRHFQGQGGITIGEEAARSA